MTVFRRVGFRPYQPDKRCKQGFSPKTKAEEKIKKEQAEKEPFLNPHCQLQKHPPNEEGYGRAWESDDWSSNHWTDDYWTPDARWFCTKAHTAWMVATPLNLANHPTHVALDLGCTRSIGSRSAIERFKNMHGIMALRRNSVVLIILSCLPTRR